MIATTERTTTTTEPPAITAEEAKTPKFLFPETALKYDQQLALALQEEPEVEAWVLDQEANSTELEGRTAGPTDPAWLELYWKATAAKLRQEVRMVRNRGWVKRTKESIAQQLERRLCDEEFGWIYEKGTILWRSNVGKSLDSRRKTVRDERAYHQRWLVLFGTSPFVVFVHETEIHGSEKVKNIEQMVGFTKDVNEFLVEELEALAKHFGMEV